MNMSPMQLVKDCYVAPNKYLFFKKVSLMCLVLVKKVFFFLLWILQLFVLRDHYSTLNVFVCFVFFFGGGVLFTPLLDT